MEVQRTIRKSNDILLLISSSNTTRIVAHLENQVRLTKHDIFSSLCHIEIVRMKLSHITNAKTITTEQLLVISIGTMFALKRYILQPHKEIPNLSKCMQTSNTQSLSPL